MLKIGTIRDPWEKILATYLHTELAKLHVASQLVYFQDFAELQQALLDNEVDMFIRPLRDLTIALPIGMCIAALSERKDSAVHLIRPKNAANTGGGGILGLSEVSKVLVRTELYAKQFKDLGFDFQCIADASSPLLGLEKIKNGEADAMTISKHTLISLGVDEANFDILRINPKEFVPEVGQGIGAVVVASDNMMLRKMFKQIHNADTAAVSNVERSILKLYQQNGEQNVLVHCEQDAQRNYHVTAFDAKGRRARMSSVTSFKLAEFVYQSLIS